MTQKAEDPLTKLRSFDTATVCNAIELLDIRDRTEGFMGFNIGCLFPELGPMVGYAVTATVRSTVPGSPGTKSGFSKLFTAIEKSPSPAILVFKDVGPDHHRSCHFGDMMATICKRLGAIGLVTDGGVRDISTVRDLGFHYFAAGATPAHGNYEIVDSDLSVTVDGALVNPGDLIHADENGVGIFPPDRLSGLLEAAHSVQDREAKKIAALMDPAHNPIELWK